MDDVVVFEVLRDTTVPRTVKKQLKEAFEAFDVDKVENIIEKILIVKIADFLLSEKELDA